MYYSLLNIGDTKENPKLIICYKDIPLYYPNQFLNNKGLNSRETREAYAKILVRFFNYLEDTYGLQDYRKVKDENALRNFMHDIIYDYTIDISGNKKFLYENQTLLTPLTANSYMRRIQGFYLELDKPLLSLIDFDSDYLEKVLSEKQRNIIRQKTKYKGIWSILDVTELDIHNNTKWKSKSKTKKSFTVNEVNWIVANLKNISTRDECIFLCCLETGARISEIRTALKKDLFKNKKGIWVLGITNSKNQERYVAVPLYLAKKINRYISSERKQITNNKSIYKYLFVSTKGSYKGELISYDTFRANLKKAGEMAGIDSKSVLSHLARGTKATKMFAESKSIEQTLITLGNKSTYEPYIDFSNPDLVDYTGDALYYIDET